MSAAPGVGVDLLRAEIMTLRCWSVLLALLVAPEIGIAQRPSGVLAGGVHMQSVGGASAGGMVLEAGVMLRVAPMLAVRPELAWVYAPSQGAPPVFATGRSSGGAGGHPHLIFAGGSLVISRTSVDSGRWHALVGGAMALGRGNDNWVATRPAFAPHLGIGWRPSATRPRFTVETRARYAPIWFNAPLRYLDIVTAWTL